MSVSQTPPDERAARNDYARFLAGSSSWFLAFGMQTLVFQWLVVETLEESPARVGLAQAAGLLPAIGLLLVGGATADRVDRRRLLVGLHAAAAVSFVSLAGMTVVGWLTYGRLLGFAVALGSITAFSLPARDGQLFDVVGPALGRGVVGANLTQQAGQAFGALVAGLLAGLGVGLVLVVQAFLVLAGALPISRLPAVADSREQTVSLVREAQEGVAIVWREPVLRSVFLLTVAIGLFFVGPYSVILPLLVRDTYAGGATEMGILAAMLPLGGILAGLVVFGRGGFARNGRALLVGQAVAAGCIAGIGMGPPFVGAALLVFGWGTASALFLNAGRTLFHEAAPDRHRSKVLALYTFGILGAGPVGALLAGLLAEAWGPEAALGSLAGAMGLAVAIVGLGGVLREV
ncbi:MAG: MFS transporter [Myxococcales bacterium]|nr:MFS transporter [Myxococcales bacterium]